ncbi:YheC/YheD family protein [Moorena sp. SIO3A2]|uniref:ATP-grasp domain-containing protein n=1 Tax=Moorena sp. SIO3A2 TaxID=2607841 RepID=UPI0013B969A8|nr:YheC/YheD family protein [Moorena sp. SIO3A2]NER88940.1 glutathione synthetase [Moorena sp. SIO3A2]
MTNKKYRILAITDHHTHGGISSIYPLLRTMAKHPVCDSIKVASRGNPKNKEFFYDYTSTELMSLLVDDNFVPQENGEQFLNASIKTDLNDHDLIFLRIDRPIPDDFFEFITSHVPEDKIINRPSGIKKTDTKASLLNFPELCPPMKLCSTLEEILEFNQKFPIVLKPLRSYGGKGIIRIVDDQAWEGNKQYSLDEYKSVIEESLRDSGDYLAMKYLKNYSKGDKRVLVVNGKVTGGFLRIPKEDSWICNMSAGGSTTVGEPDQDEIRIAETIIPSFLEQGIVIFGFDTLVDDDGKRVLSEINTLNVTGLEEAQTHSGKPVVQESSDLMWSYICEHIG